MMMRKTTMSRIQAKKLWWQAASLQVKLVDRVASQGASREDARLLRAHGKRLDRRFEAYRDSITKGI